MEKKFFMPVSLQELLTDFLAEDKDNNNLYQAFYKYAYIIHRIYFSFTAFKSEYKYKGVALNIKTLSSILGQSDGTTCSMIANLENLGIIRAVSGFIIGKQSKHYKLISVHEKAKISMLTVKAYDAKFIKKLVFNENHLINANKLVRTQYLILKNRISLSEEGLSFLKSKYPKLSNAIDCYPGYVDIDYKAGIEPQDIILVSFLIKDFFVTRPDAKSRIYSNLTSLKKEYRKYLLLDGKPIMSTDLVNSQILFSVIVIENKMRQLAGKKDFVLPEDFITYKALAQVGQLYETIASKAGYDLDENNRKNFKQSFFKDVFFSEVTSVWTTKIKTAFYALFPSVATTIEKIKKNDHSDFAISLQRMEAGIMIDSIHKQLCKAKILNLTIHDSIVVGNTKELAHAEMLIRKVLKEKYNLDVALKQEKTAKKHIPLNLDKSFYKKPSAA